MSDWSHFTIQQGYSGAVLAQSKKHTNISNCWIDIKVNGKQREADYDG